MKEEELGQEPAFSIAINNDQDYIKGMSKRFYAACCAMQGLLANPDVYTNKNSVIINSSFQLADELLKQERE